MSQAQQLANEEQTHAPKGVIPFFDASNKQQKKSLARTKILSPPTKTLISSCTHLVCCLEGVSNSARNTS